MSEKFIKITVKNAEMIRKYLLYYCDGCSDETPDIDCHDCELDELQSMLSQEITDRPFSVIESLEELLSDLCAICKSVGYCNEVPCNFEHNSAYVRKTGTPASKEDN